MARFEKQRTTLGDLCVATLHVILGARFISAEFENKLGAPFLGPGGFAFGTAKVWKISFTIEAEPLVMAGLVDKIGANLAKWRGPQKVTIMPRRRKG